MNCYITYFPLSCHFEEYLTSNNIFGSQNILCIIKMYIKIWHNNVIFSSNYLPAVAIDEQKLE